MNNVIKARGETLSSIVNAEKTNPKEDPKPEKKNQGQKKRILLLVSAFVFFILGIGAVAGVTFFVNQEEKEIAELSPGIIFANRTATIARDDSVIADLATLRQDTDMSLGEVLRVVVTEGSFEASPTTVAQALNLPPLLVREIVDVMIGVHAFDRNQPFIILKVRMFDRSFNALLDTERTLGEALGDFFAPLNAASNAPKLTFRDTIINNIDTRRSQDAWPIIYAYPSRDTLIITTNEFTLREVVMRLNQ
ncbi:MAG: hypothetical protein ACJKTH_01025 [Patescibacteria group bacterium UBA2163]